MNLIRRSIINGSNYGKLMMLIGLLVAFPLIILPFYPVESQYASAFILPSVISVILGAAVCFLTPAREDSTAQWQSSLQKGSSPVVFAWCYAFLTGAAPSFISGRLSFTHALFESVNGWTTAGFSVIDVTTVPHIFLFHRSFMQFCGGLGFIIMIAMLVQGKHAMNLYNAEGHQDRIMPNLRRTARMIFLLYTGFLIIGILLYCLFGMDLFEAVCHSMSALSTAGYTTRAGSIGEYSSLPIEIITIILMLIGSTNFAVLLMIVKRRFRQIARISELKFLLILLVIFIPLTALSLIREMGVSIADGFRNAVFGVISIVTTTGYSITNYTRWPPFALGLLMLLMMIGGSAGSTAGGIKLTRVYLLIRITRENIRNRLAPSRNISVPVYYRAQGKTLIDDSIFRETTGYIFCYLGVFITGTLLLTLTAGCSLFDAMFEFASALGTIGISNGLTNVGAGTGTLIVMMAGMVLGRLEIYIVFVAIFSGVRTVGHWIARDAK